MWCFHLKLYMPNNFKKNPLRNRNQTHLTPYITLNYDYKIYIFIDIIVLGYLLVLQIQTSVKQGKAEQTLWSCNAFIYEKIAVFLHKNTNLGLNDSRVCLHQLSPSLLSKKRNLFKWNLQSSITQKHKAMINEFASLTNVQNSATRAWRDITSVWQTINPRIQKNKKYHNFSPHPLIFFHFSFILLLTSNKYILLRL